MRLGITCLALWLAVTAAPCFADDEADDRAESRWRLGAAIGYGERSNPLVQSDDIPILIDLDIAWFGDHWFFDNGDLGVTFADNKAVTASLVLRFNSDRVFFGRTDTRIVTVDAIGNPLESPVDFKPPKRDFAIEMGAELLTDGNWGALQLSAYHDVSGTHEGFEVYADYSYGRRRQRLYIEPSFGASYKSANLNNYYWGITETEAGVAILPYEADAGVNWHARLLLSYQLTRQWALSLTGEYERLNTEAAASPIVEDEHVFGFFAGAVYRF